ncbi:uncharacterized protein TNCV_3342561 [Trichonephila clavipes]|nr:uncharacterized protein TNCV_3342561 [Trichonephila clavipes]
MQSFKKRVTLRYLPLPPNNPRAKTIACLRYKQNPQQQQKKCTATRFKTKIRLGIYLLSSFPISKESNSTSGAGVEVLPILGCRRSIEQRGFSHVFLQTIKPKREHHFLSEQNSIVRKFRDGSCSTSSDYSERRRKRTNAVTTIKDLLKKWEAVRAMVLECHPNQADVSRVGDLYNDNAINYFWKILKKGEKQSTLDMFFNAPLAENEKD